MATKQEMLELVEAHAALDEPTETAIWIRREDREAWLVELLPDLRDDPHPERHVAFTPGRSFKYPLNLIASNLDGLKKAFDTDAALARAVAEGDVLWGVEQGRELQRLARDAHGRSGPR